MTGSKSGSTVSPCVTNSLANGRNAGFRTGKDFAYTSFLQFSELSASSSAWLSHTLIELLNLTYGAAS